MTQPLPDTRAALLVLHAAARQRRDRSPLGGEEYRKACEEISAIEVQIARVERPPDAVPKPVAKPVTEPNANGGS